MLERNLKATIHNKVPGYIPLFIVNSREEADIVIAKLRPFVDNRTLPANPLKPTEPNGVAVIAAGISELTFEELMRRLNK